MTTTKPELNWKALDGWYRNKLVGFGQVRGLIRVSLDGRIMFIGRAAAMGSSLKSRLDAYSKPYGTGRNHYAGKMIYAHRAEILMEYAVLDLPAFEINQLADDLIEMHEPPWNMQTDRFRS